MAGLLHAPRRVLFPVFSAKFSDFSFEETPMNAFLSIDIAQKKLPKRRAADVLMIPPCLAGQHINNSDKYSLMHVFWTGFVLQSSSLRSMPQHAV